MSVLALINKSIPFRQKLPSMLPWTDIFSFALHYVLDLLIQHSGIWQELMSDYFYERPDRKITALICGLHLKTISSSGETCIKSAAV